MLRRIWGKDGKTTTLTLRLDPGDREALICLAWFLRFVTHAG